MAASGKPDYEREPSWTSCPSQIRDAPAGHDCGIRIICTSSCRGAKCSQVHSTMLNQRSGGQLAWLKHKHRVTEADLTNCRVHSCSNNQYKVLVRLLAPEHPLFSRTAQAKHPCGHQADCQIRNSHAEMHCRSGSPRNLNLADAPPWPTQPMNSEHYGVLMVPRLFGNFG
jgi:hypothetical protein